MPAAERSIGGAPGLSRRTELIAVAVLIVAFVALLVPTLDNPLLEKSAFRQTQTAYTALLYHEDGIDLLHPRVPVLGEPFEIPFEFPLFQASASLLMDAGLDADTAMRVTALICFLATALLLFGLVRYVAGRLAAFGALVAFMVTPYALVWSRASMIEYLATAGAVGFTWAFVAWRDDRRRVVWALCLLAGLVGMLVKPTTAIFWLIPAVAYRTTSPRPRDRRHLAWASAVAAIPVLAALAWTAYADSIKSDSATTEWLTSRALRDWNFGTLDQRLDPDAWVRIGKVYVFAFIGPLGLVLLAVAAVAAWVAYQRRFWIGMACTALLPPLVFTNLYVVHDYYPAAVTPAVAALIGLGASFAVDRIRARGTRAAWAAAGVGLIAMAVWFALGHRYWDALEARHQDPEAYLPLAAELERATQPTDPVATVGLDWNPAVFYYARRRGHMVVGENEPFAYDLVHDDGYRHLLVKEPDETDLGFLDRWTWVGAVTEHVYAVADDASELPSAELVTTSEPAGSGGTALADAPTRIPCDAPVAIPAGSRGTWVELESPPDGALIAVGGGLAPLLARRTVFVSSTLARNGRLTLTCTGADELEIVAVRDAGPPG